MQTRSSDENSVCLSVRLFVRPSVRLSVTRVIPDKMEERSVQIFIPYERTFSLVFWEEERLVAGDPFYVKFWVNDPHSSEIADFQSIIARSSSAVTPGEKSSINANRKSTTLFPMSLRWSSYVAHKSPKGGLKTQNGRFPFKKCTSLEESLLQSFFVWKLSAAML